MPRFNEIINNFINGEVSPRVYGRMDSEIYKRSCRTVKNMLVYPQGGAARRSGTQYLKRVVPVSGGSLWQSIQEGARIVPFIFNEREKYLLVFNKFQGTTFNENFISYIRVDNELENWASMNNLMISVTGPTTARTSTAASSARTSDALQDSKVLEEMQYAQAGAYMVFVHETFPPFVVARVAENILAIDSYQLQFYAAASTDFGPVPFNRLNLSNLTLNPSATTGTITITASASFFVPQHVGSFICFSTGGTVGIAVIAGYTSATLVDAVVVRTLPASGATVNWYEAAWSDYRGWPRTVAFWNSALYFGGSPSFPDRLWKSQDFDIFEMANPRTQGGTGTLTAVDPFWADLAVGTGIAKINFLAPIGNDLIIGAATREYSVASFNIEDVTVKPQTGYGSEYVQPVVVDDTPVYVQRGGRKLREIIFDDRTQGYVSPDITLLSEHISRKGAALSSTKYVPRIKALAYQTLDNNVIWAIDNNGFLFACTKSRENSVVAYHWHDVGGKVESIACLPSKDNKFDELYMIVAREVDGSIVRYIEKLGSDFNESTLNLGESIMETVPVFVDSAKVFMRKAMALLFAPFTVNTDLAVDAGISSVSNTGTIINGDFGGLALSSASYVTIEPSEELDFAQRGCVRIKANRAPSTIFSIAESDSSDDNLIRLRWGGTDGDELRLTVKDQGGSTIINDVSFGKVPGGDKQLFVLELNYDFTAGETRLFVNGKQLGATSAATCTRDQSAIGRINIGATFNNTDAGGIDIMDFHVYGEPQNTEDHEILGALPWGVTLWNLEHLEGEEVAVVADGNYVGDFTVVNGQIDDIGVDYYEAGIVVVGKKYEHLLEIQPIDIGSGVGSAMGSIKRIDRAVVRFNQSAAAKVGPDTANLTEIIFRDSLTPADQAIELVTGDKEIDFYGPYDREARALITHDAPLPCNVTCLSLRGVTGDV